MEKVVISEKLAAINEHWKPRVAAELNGQEVKIVKILGEFPWHHHENEDELFLVWQGQINLEFRDRTVTLNAGEMLVVPRGVEHRPVAAAEASLVLFEPANVPNTGNLTNSSFTAPNGVPA